MIEFVDTNPPDVISQAVQAVLVPYLYTVLLATAQTGVTSRGINKHHFGARTASLSPWLILYSDSQRFQSQSESLLPCSLLFGVFGSWSFLMPKWWPFLLCHFLFSSCGKTLSFSHTFVKDWPDFQSEKARSTYDLLLARLTAVISRRLVRCRPCHLPTMIRRKRLGI